MWIEGPIKLSLPRQIRESYRIASLETEADFQRCHTDVHLNLFVFGRWVFCCECSRKSCEEMTEDLNSRIQSVLAVHGCESSETNVLEFVVRCRFAWTDIAKKTCISGCWHSENDSGSNLTQSLCKYFSIIGGKSSCHLDSGSRSLQSASYVTPWLCLQICPLHQTACRPFLANTHGYLLGFVLFPFQKSIVVYYIAAQSHVFFFFFFWCSPVFDVLGGYIYIIYLLSLLSSLFSLLILSLLFVFRCHRIDNAMYNYYVTSHSFTTINTRLLILNDIKVILMANQT